MADYVGNYVIQRNRAMWVLHLFKSNQKYYEIEHIVHGDDICSHLRAKKNKNNIAGFRDGLGNTMFRLCEPCGLEVHLRLIMIKLLEQFRKSKQPGLSLFLS